MSALIQDRKLAVDDWRTLADEEAAPPAGRLIVSLARWQRDAEALRERADPVGVRIPNTADLAPIWPSIADRPLIALEFPAFSDGRAYSQARLLRDRHGFKGIVRAGGAAVVRDQLYGMMRCGIDVFELRADQDPAVCLTAFADFNAPYQTAADGKPGVHRQRRA